MMSRNMRSIVCIVLLVACLELAACFGYKLVPVDETQSGTTSSATQEESNTESSAAISEDNGPNFPEIDEASIVERGTCGGCTWVIDNAGRLTIYPTDGERGELVKDYEYEYGFSTYKLFSWAAYANKITSCVIEDGVWGKDLSFMFWSWPGGFVFVSIDLSGLDLSQTTNMNSMFSNCSSLTSLDLSSFDTSNVTDMSNMFSYCSSLTSLDLSSFDTSNVTYMTSIFMGCSALTSLELSSFDTSNVTDMLWMFNGCSALNSLDLSSFVTANVADMEGMFGECAQLEKVFVSEGWTTEALYSLGLDIELSMFEGCWSLVGGNGTTYDSSHNDVEYARIDEPGSPGYFTRK